MSETIVRKDEDAERRLRELGLRSSYMDEAVRAGVKARYPDNEFEPRSAGGLKDWIARVGKLRFQVVENAGWVPADPQNVPLVVDQSNDIALGVLLGDNKTGISWTKGPSSKYPKGKAVAQATAEEEETPTLDLDLTQSGGRAYLTSDDLRRMDVWFLVTYALPAREGELEQFEVYQEVSLAAPITPGSYISGWKERLVLSKRSFPLLDPPQETEEPKEIDVYVEAK